MAHFFCVNSSVGYLMQGLTVDLVSIYSKEDSGSKTHGEKIPNAMSRWIWSIPDTESAACRIPNVLKAWN